MSEDEKGGFCAGFLWGLIAAFILSLTLIVMAGCSNKPVVVTPPAPPPAPCVTMDVAATSHVRIADDGSGPAKTAAQAIQQHGGVPCP
jgi:hypothetical protein